MEILFSDHFKKQLRKLKMKYPHITNDLLDIIKIFEPKNEISVGRSIFKIRVPSSDMKKGKSGGFRAYIFIFLRKNLLVPLCIYAKSNTESISENQLKYHFDQTIKEVIPRI